MAKAFLGLGGNVGDSRATLDRAIAMLVDGRSIKLLARSSDYQTPPWGVENQAPFVNLCLAVETTLTPRQLLQRIHEIERALGRDRAAETHWGPRTCDIDILAYDDVRLNEPNLTLPHPRMFERGFVLIPLAEIAPDAMIGGRRVQDALKAADTEGIVRLPPR
ncbi:MAG TPA: 2-amino-4-hydroxy-6-hydroxymethyldihydropteridine diphosphokinase [Pseudolabrys sp.]|jgi:2-amino-4-hydroxy-6-hydroxymethyldihydropteridine diphosphokinase|nr:2-amino-4-hydroxy-6-hydroxymethyldihydropteridine diphosphokinase [Pseudolabrys sp.]